jgi:hypothetical protein
MMLPLGISRSRLLITVSGSLLARESVPEKSWPSPGITAHTQQGPHDGHSLRYCRTNSRRKAGGKSRGNLSFIDHGMNPIRSSR